MGTSVTETKPARVRIVEAGHRPKAPRGTYWCNGVLWARMQVKRTKHCFSLETDFPEEAARRRKTEKRRLLDRALHPTNPELWHDISMTSWCRHSRDDGFIYFVEDEGFVKIGFAKDWQSRVSSLQTGNRREIKVLYIMRGMKKPDEYNFHQRFQNLRFRGEWFKHEGKLADWLARMLSSNEQSP